MKPKEINLESYFQQFRKNIVGIDKTFTSAYGKMPIVYTDWTASGRLYAPIEEKIAEDFGPFVANTHTDTSITGSVMTLAYHEAKKIIKKHVNASDDDIFIQSGHGMTGAINKLQRIMGLKIHEKYKNLIQIDENERPIVFVTHMEHHSNQTSWLETVADLEIIPHIDEKNIDYDAFEQLIRKYERRRLKIASVSACSNVTGLQPDYHRIAKMIHRVKGFCFVDFACSAPYVKIDMHPKNENEKLDAIFFSPHKFLGGPGTSGILIFSKNLYHNRIPDNPGGGTVVWTNPWKEHKYFSDPETREDGGTPGFLQAIKTALAIQLKEAMGVENIQEREHEILNQILPELKKIKNLHLLADKFTDRLGVISFTIDGLNYHLGVRMLNDKFGIQTRGGCSCAGTYGHLLLGVDQEKSEKIVKEIEKGDTRNKPGWIRLSIHPTTTDEEVAYIISAIKELATKHQEWFDDYVYVNHEYIHKTFHPQDKIKKELKNWFKI